MHLINLCITAQESANIIKIRNQSIALLFMEAYFEEKKKKKNTHPQTVGSHAEMM